MILPAASYDLWLDPGFRDVAATTEMLKPYDAGLMRRYAVSTWVNNVANDDRQCSEPIEVSGAIQTQTFLMNNAGCFLLRVRPHKFSKADIDSNTLAA